MTDIDSFRLAERHPDELHYEQHPLDRVTLPTATRTHQYLRGAVSINREDAAQPLRTYSTMSRRTGAADLLLGMRVVLAAAGTIVGLLFLAGLGFAAWQFLTWVASW